MHVHALPLPLEFAVICHTGNATGVNASWFMLTTT